MLKMFTYNLATYRLKPVSPLHANFPHVYGKKNLKILMLLGQFVGVGCSGIIPLNHMEWLL